MGFQHGLSGLNAASNNLDIIGHNIANSNTVGFKSSRGEFAEMVAASVAGASAGTSGIGVNLVDVAQQFSQGTINSTNNSLDVAINGNGFFVVNSPAGIAYTRAGNFQLDRQGNLITATGDNVMGYTVDPVTGERNSVELSELAFPVGQPIPAKQTTAVTATLNLDARAGLAAGDPLATPPVAATPRATYGTSLQVYDSLGVAHDVSLYFEKTGTNEWTVYDSLDSTATALGTATFDTTGKLTAMTPSPLALNITTSSGATTPLTPSVDLSGLTQFGSSFSVSKLSQDGYASGELTGVTVAGDGKVLATYSNGITRAEGQLAMAKFTNTQGLAPAGNNNWVVTQDSGPAIYGTAGDGNYGVLQGSALEESNVDITAELVNMMTAQRAYQANAQTIKTQDQVFSSLVNLR